MNPLNKVVLAGAGPGDPDLVTVKALQAIRNAEVILYDALVNEELLAHAKKDCVLVFVGKQRGMHACTQEKINGLLLFYVQRFSNVLRLKGGDPFVFGRGYEEVGVIQQHGYTVEVIPGISSAIAGPSSAGIPVTLRGISESFWVVTGTISSGAISADIALAAQSTATVIILMGMSRLPEIAEHFKMYRGPDEPVAIIHKATWPDQVTLRGTIGSICDLVRNEAIISPAIILIGKVAGCHSASEILRHEDLKMKVAV